MTETHICPVEGCDHAPFKTSQALKSHIRNIHPEFETGRQEVRQVPIVEEDFATLLKKFKIGGSLATNIAENISHTGGPSVFEDPELLFKRLAAWSSDVNPSRRKLIIEQWFAEKGIGIPPNVRQMAGMTTEQIRKAEVGPKEGEGVRYVFDEEKSVVRMAKEGERGGTLAQAKELKVMAEESGKAGAESPFMQDGEGRWVLNPKARVTGVELMAVQFMQQAQARGEAPDPIEAMTRAAQTWTTLREGLGVGAVTTPTWQTDPAEFIKTVKAISGETGGDSALKEALGEMQRSMEELKEERYREQFASQQKQILDLSNVLKQSLNTISDLQKGLTGRTEMDIIHDIATGSMEFLRTELPGMRKDIRDAIGSSALPPRKSAEERENRNQQTRKALKTDQDIEEIGKRLFFSQG
ncbi:hypothetical protein ES703_00361 [subsurface metagenome]